jgi:ABC-type branched-subunit amino acid transport system substrate-binding protein
VRHRLNPNGGKTSSVPPYRGAIGTFWLVLALALAGCGQPEAEGDPKLTIYVSAPLTGPAGEEGRDAADGARLALADAEGEAAGIEVEAEYLDVAGRNESRSDPVSAGRNARTATEDSTSIAYIGELDSATSRTSVPITNSAGLLQVAPGSGATDLVVEETFDDSVPEDVQATGERTFARVLPSDDDVQEHFGDEDLISGPASPEELPDPAQERLERFEAEYARAPGPWAAYGYEAMASALAAIERAEDPLSRSSVVAAYFDGTERDSVLGSYSITEEGETTLDEPLGPYRITGDGGVALAPVDQGG